MPSSTRKQRKLQRKQRQEQFRSEGSLSATPETPPSHASPHPYHPPPPPNYSSLGRRSNSQTSQVSDISMDDFGGAQESVLEYSDTSDENREDAYFSQAGQLTRKVLGERSSTAGSGESAFRDLRAHGRKSSRIVRFSSTKSSLKSQASPFEDEHEEDVGDEEILPTRHHEESELRSPTIKNWVANLAYSFRSPAASVHKKNAGNKGSKHRSQPSSSTIEYPYTSMIPWSEQQKVQSVSQSSIPWEASPLLRVGQAGGVYGGEYAAVGQSGGHPPKATNGGNGERERAELTGRPKSTPLKSKSTAATIAACYLTDYEAGRPPTLSPDFATVTPRQLKVYRFHFSWLWTYFGIYLAVLVLFLAHTQDRFVTASMHTYAISLFFVEIWMREELHGPDHSEDQSHTERYLVFPLILFLFFLGLESWVWYIFIPVPHVEIPILASAVFKPVVFFYVSLKARHALESLIRIGRIVTRVLIIEMFLILTFAAVACQLFQGYDSFANLSTSWLSLFQLSTTVVNPSLWMPMYEESRSNAIFFVFFIIISVFYLHSLVLSVVFQTYIQAAGEIHDRCASDREDAIRLAFLALVRDDQSEYISAASVRKTLQVVRPHYSTMKIKALMDIVDPTTQHIIDYPTFRTKIRQALNASIRTARSTSNFAMGIELIAVLVAVVNFVYVILFTSEFQAAWFDKITVTAGCAITLLGLLELVIRFNPLRFPNFAPITRLNATFDGLALVAALVSCIGIVQYVAGYEFSIDYMLMGRAIDMIRIMRFFQIFRDVVRRSADVLPALAGPVLLVLATIHVFVYLGMGLWGGAVDVDVLATNSNITSLYYLNNFNSYTEGLVTVFNVLVVNDWHAIAEVFLYSNRCSSPTIVYPYFIATLCCGVFIMLNVITAFFVESFVTKLEDKSKDDPNDDLVDSGRDNNEFSIRTGENTNVKRISSTRTLRELSEPADEAPVLNGDSQSVSTSNSTGIFAFDVYEREGFDQIMRTVAGSSNQEQEAFARSVCDYLEVFESLSAGREKVGYMICCQQSMNRFGNRRFQSSAREFVKDDVLHKIVSDMHSELLVLTSNKAFEDRCLVRTFAHKTDPSLKLEISASLLRHQPAVSLLVSRIKPASRANP